MNKKNSISFSGVTFELKNTNEELLSNIQKFIDSEISNAENKTKRSDTTYNLAFAYLKLIIDLWDDIKFKYYATDEESPSILTKLELLNDRIKEKMEELDGSMD